MKTQKSYSISGIILFLLSFLYLCVELVFNRRLLDISSSVRSDPQQVDHLQYFGRAASGLGFTLLVLGIFQQFGFKITGWKQWTIFSVIALMCLMPFIMTFGQTFLETLAGEDHAQNDATYTTGIAWGALSFVGLNIVSVSRGTKPFAVALGIIILAWPAMFYGQKLAVERFIISPTTVEDRLNAHYILLLRSGIEDCIISLEDTQFCDANGVETDVEKHSTRAIMGSLFMLNTTAVFNGLSISKDQIIDSIAARDMWFSTGEYYQRYLQEVADKREQYEQYLNDTYYSPYKQASDLYLKAYNNAVNLSAQASQPEHLQRIAEDASRQVEDGIEQSWQHYLRAIATYHDIVLSQVGQAAVKGQNVYAKICNGHEAACARILSKEYNGMSADGAFTQAQQRAQTTADQKFYEQTGYPPNIKSKDDFLQNPKTQSEIRSNIEKKIQEQIPDYTLPPQWQYDSSTFKNELLHLLQQEAQSKTSMASAEIQKAWHDKAMEEFKIDIDPGLSREEFFKRLGGDPLPPLKDLTVSEDEFREKYIIPANRKVADKALEQIKDEAPSYANDQNLAEQGKDYIRVLYIPAIALCLSVIIVMVTLGRYAVALAVKMLGKTHLFKSMTKIEQSFVRPIFWAAFLALVLTLPYRWPNPYTSGAAYQKYYSLAHEKYPATAQLLDWVVHMQPIIYRVGSHMPEALYTLPEKLEPSRKL